MIDEILTAIDAWDGAWVQAFQTGLHNEAVLGVMQFVTNAGHWFLPLLIVWLFLLFKGGSRGRAAAILLLPMLLLSDTCTDKLFKPLLSRPRPLGHGGLSLPSTHATNAFAIATLLSFFIRRWAFAVPAYALAALVAFSRLYIGVHYPTDILAGAILGIIDAFIVIGIYLLLRPRLESAAPFLFTPEKSSSPTEDKKE